MICIPGGSFLMGSPQDVVDKRNNECPQHRVTVQPFYMSKHPITQGQYQEVVGENPSHFKGANRPVENVTWHDATEFCQRLSQKTGKSYRLPSESQWEYACRAGTTTPFYFGETITPDLANYDGHFGYSPKPNQKETTDVGSFSPNTFGLYDMHGNVWEWCQDVWHSSYKNAPADGSAWESGGEPSYRMARGGSWGDYPIYCRSASRDWGGANDRNSFRGFRVVY